MSFTLTIFGPKHYFWRNMPMLTGWFVRPDEDSTGGVGFRALWLHVCFMWGQR